ncbi:MAG: 16S rRNA (cytosine(1402)-N(4))-methyltransferase RsmH [Actinobacteria bacterium]|nr:16S rRNA (cytosine(1402)-N(4))-methyltransferase RsmH [Actinomycetota bacterium]
MKNEYRYRHQPVMLAEVLQYLNLKKGSTIVDCTLGGAGHAAKIAEKIIPGGWLVGLDADNAAINAARNVLAPFGQHIQISLVQSGFDKLDDVLMELGTGLVDGFLYDLGISSYHAETPERGFSYNQDGPLDMRFDTRQELTAEMVVNKYSEDELARIIKQYGEEKFARRIAKFIVERRKIKPIKTTKELVEIIKDAIPASERRKGHHPAKKTFQALRIEVNKELERIEKSLDQAIRWLKPGGRIVVISYQSLEDRLVKSKFQDWSKSCICPPKSPVCVCGRKPIAKLITKKPLKPKKEEVELNPRSRSATLRAIERV